MNYEGRLFINAAMSAVQVVAVGVVFVVLYRYVLDTLGQEAFGVWALVLATTSLGALANLGFAAGAVKFVAQHQARNDRQYVRSLIQTAVLSVLGGVGVIVLLLYPLLYHLLQVIVEPAALLPDARLILPYALGSFWLTATAAVVQSCIDGLHRVYVRNLLVIVASLAYLVLAFLLVPRLGLEGLALAQFIQAGAVTILSWIVLRRLFPWLPIVPFMWSRRAFREMLAYSLNFQAISIAQILFEPAAKALLSRFGGVASVSSFEFAHRMAIQLRALVTTAHQAIVPTISHMHERNPGLLRTVYTGSFRLLLFVIAATLPLLLSLTPDISRLWIGWYDPSFVLFANLLLTGWFLNMLANPAYFANMGTGALKWNLYGHMVISVAFLLLGPALGAITGADGIVLSYFVALLLGSFTIAGVYQREHGIKANELADRETLRLTLAGLLALAVAYVAIPQLAESFSPALRLLLVVAVYSTIVAGPLLHHSMRREMQTRIRRAFAPA